MTADRSLDAPLSGVNGLRAGVQNYRPLNFGAILIASIVGVLGQGDDP